jgi:hypothetical protein
MKLMIAVAFAAAGAIASYFAPTPGAHDPDAVTTASVHADAAGALAFTATNLADNTTCLISRSTGGSGRTSSVKADSNCESVWPKLTDARNWTANSDGTVSLTSASGGEVLTLAQGDGVAYIAVDPPSATISFSAKN